MPGGPPACAAVASAGTTTRTASRMATRGDGMPRGFSNPGANPQLPATIQLGPDSPDSDVRLQQLARARVADDVLPRLGRRGVQIRAADVGAAVEVGRADRQAVVLRERVQAV